MSDHDENSHLRLVAQQEPKTKAEKVRGQPVTAAAKRRVALELRAAGLTYGAIAEQLKKLGYKTSENGVRTIITNALDAMAQDDQQNAVQIRQMDLSRLDQIMTVLWPKVKGGDLKAIREYRACVDQRSRLLGTYAAVKHEIYGQVDHVLSAEDVDEVRRLEEAFVASGPAIVDAEVVNEEGAQLPAPPSEAVPVE